MTKRDNHYIDADEMRNEWMKIYFWNQLSVAEPQTYSTLATSISAEHGMDYLTSVLETSGAISEKLGEFFKKIAFKVSSAPCFVNYSFKDEMIGDALLNMTRYADRYNPKKSKNIFSYFSKIVFNSFIVRIKKEEKQRTLVSKYQEENFPLMMMKQVEGKCAIYINPEHSIEEALTSMETKIHEEENNWD